MPMDTAATLNLLTLAYWLLMVGLPVTLARL